MSPNFYVPHQSMLTQPLSYMFLITTSQTTSFGRPECSVLFFTMSHGQEMDLHSKGHLIHVC